MAPHSTVTTYSPLFSNYFFENLKKSLYVPAAKVKINRSAIIIQGDRYYCLLLKNTTDYFLRLVPDQLITSDPDGISVSGHLS